MVGTFVGGSLWCQCFLFSVLENSSSRKVVNRICRFRISSSAFPSNKQRRKAKVLRRHLYMDRKRSGTEAKLKTFKHRHSAVAPEGEFYDAADKIRRNRAGVNDSSEALGG